MAQEILEEVSLNHLLKAVSHLVQPPKTHMWLDYNAEADLLYLHFEQKPIPTHSEIRAEGIIPDYSNGRLAGLTVLDASHR